jgi:(heptosyl)LPS beta-1,4-glucosyltransferase
VDKLVAVVLTKNEAAHIADCVAALCPWLATVIVWDSGSADGTQTLARQAGALVVERPFDNFSAQRQAVLDTIKAEWLLFVDADERVTPALVAEIKKVVAAGQDNGYWIPRRNWIAGQEIRYGGYSPDYQLRLLRRAAACYDTQREVHEFALVEGTTGKLHEPLIHYNYRDWGQFHRKQRAYALYEARILAARGIRPRPHNFILQPWREFHRRLITLGGWRDGWPGVRLALLLAWYYGFIPYWQLVRRGG